MASSSTDNLPEKHSYDSIIVGSVRSFERIITEDDVMDFARMTGDFNPLHVDKEYGKASQFGRNIVHGMLLGSMFSTMIGMYCPGEKSLYLSQSLNFKNPVFYGDKIIVKSTVLGKMDAFKMITLKMEIIKDGIVAVYGEAKAKVL